MKETSKKLNIKTKRTFVISILVFILILIAPMYSFAATIGTTSITNISSTTNSVSISWKKVTSVSGYEVYRGTYNLGKTTSTKYTDSNLKAATKYTYKVRAYKKTTVKKKYYYNTKKKKWQTTKPAAKDWKGKKVKYVTSAKYTYGKFCTAKSCNTKAEPEPTEKYVNIRTIAPNANENVLNAYETLGFKCLINCNATYTGYFDARTRLITLRREDNNIYHELGHFVAFVAGNVDTGSAFKAIYEEEKSLYTGRNPLYVLQDSSEYFAESYREYILNQSALKNERPKTYEAIVDATNRITDAQVARIQRVYGSIWN